MKKLILALGLLFLCSNAWARTATWDGGDAGALASTAANWDTDTAPVAGDIVVFDATSGDNCTWDITASIASINTTGYTGLVTASVTMTVTGSVTFANNTFAHGSQLFKITNTSTITTNTGNPFYQLTFDTGIGKDITLGSDFTVNNTFTLAHLTYVRFYGSYVLRLKGDIVADTSCSMGYGASGIGDSVSSISIEGSGNQNIDLRSDLGYTHKININIASTGGTVYFGNYTHELGGSLTKSSGTVDFITNTSTVAFHNFKSAHNVMSGTFYNLTMSTYDSSTLYALTLDGNITVNNNYVHGTTSSNVDGYVKLIGYRIYAKGSVTLNDYAAPGNTTVLDINGSGAQAVDLRGSVSYYNNIPIEVTNTSTVTFSNNNSYTDSTITFNGSGTYNLGTAVWYHKTGQITYTAGTVNASTSTLNIKGSFTSSTNGLSWYNITASATNTLTLSSLLTSTNTFQTTGGTTTLSGSGGLALKDLTIDTATTLSAGSNIITLTGNFAKTGTFTSGTSTVVFNGTSTASGATAFYSLTVNSGKTLNLTAGQTFSTNASGTFYAVSATIASTSGTDAIFNMNGSQSVALTTATDIDSSGGSTVHNYLGTNTGTINWDTAASATPVTTAYTWVG